MKNYHISKNDGQVRICSAKTPQSCTSERPEGLQEHYTDKQLAQTAYEKSQQTFTPILSKKKKTQPSMPQRIMIDNKEFDEQKYKEKSYNYFNSLTEKERQALDRYRGADYYDINSSLYNNEQQTPAIQESIKNIDSAIEKHTQAPPKVLWRGLAGKELPKMFNDKNHKVGDILEFPGYTSTTETKSGLTAMPKVHQWYIEQVPYKERQKDPKNPYKVLVPEEFKKTVPRNVIFSIKTKQAVPMNSQSEQEWLIPRGKKFKITEIHKERYFDDGRNDENIANLFVIEEV